MVTHIVTRAGRTVDFVDDDKNRLLVTYGRAGLQCWPDTIVNDLPSAGITVEKVSLRAVELRRNVNLAFISRTL